MGVRVALAQHRRSGAFYDHRRAYGDSHNRALQLNNENVGNAVRQDDHVALFSGIYPANGPWGELLTGSINGTTVTLAELGNSEAD